MTERGGVDGIREGTTRHARATAGIDVVVKVGGSILEIDGALDRTASALVKLARWKRGLVVPGGGRFADAVRACERDHGLDASAAHWMAILAMDQYAHLLASRIDGAALVEHRRDLAPALAARRLPVLAPYRWLREADPLPHSWEVTSDSIAAWIAGALGASLLLLVKPVAGDAARVADAHFARARPANVDCRVIGPEEIHSLAD